MRERWQEGQSASLACGLAALSDCDAAVVTLGDLPRLWPKAISGSWARRGAAVRATDWRRSGRIRWSWSATSLLLRDVTGDHGARTCSAASASRGRGLSTTWAVARTWTRRSSWTQSVTRSSGVRSGGGARAVVRGGRSAGARLGGADRRAPGGPCLPGAEIDPDSDDDGTYRGSFTVKLGPTTASDRGQLHMEEVDEASRRVVMRASGQGQARPGHGEGEHRERDELEGDTTKVDVETDFTLTGRLALLRARRD